MRKKENVKLMLEKLFNEGYSSLSLKEKKIIAEVVSGRKMGKTKCPRCRHKSFMDFIDDKPYLYPKYCGKCGRKYPNYLQFYYKSKWYFHHIMDKFLHLKF